MGGSGSGRYYYGSVGDNGRDLTDRQKRISISFLKKQGYLTPGKSWSVNWSRGRETVGNINGVTRTGKIILGYQCRISGGDWEQVIEPIVLTSTPCHYGGVREWFLCPGINCGRRVGILYATRRYFLCRQCCQLAYRSQREALPDRLLTRAQNLRERLGGNGDIGDFFPEKPKGMHWKTYERLKEEGEWLERMQWGAMAFRFGL